MSDHPAPGDRPRLRVLIVDDSEDDAKLIERQLERGGYELAAVRVDTIDGLRQALAGGDWDLILADFVLPTLNALDALAIARADGRDIPFIVVSGSVGEDTAVQAMRAGAHDYFAKSEMGRLVAAAEREMREAERRGNARRSRIELELRFQALANSAPVLIWIAGPDGRRTWFNRSWLEFRGQPAEAELGDGWKSGLHADDRERYERALQEAVARHEPLRTQLRLRSAEGRYGWMLENATPLFDASGRFSGHIGSAADITQEKEAREVAEAANRMKEEFLATLSHELRTPLNAILGWAHILQEPGADDDTRRKALRTIERNAHLQAHIVADMLDVSRIVTGKLHLNVRNVDLGEVIDSVVESLRLAVESKRIAVQLALDPEAQVVAGDADRLQQVVWNLLSNAIKFAPPGGRLCIALRAAEDESVLEVEDEGPGIPADFLPFMFDRFRQADSSTTRRHGGLGLGLAIVRHLVEAHGGRVTAENRTDRSGARLTVRLPRRVGVKPAAAPIADDGVPSLDGISVLVVEDDADSLELICTVLERAGAKVASATTAAAALRVLTRERPTVLVSDIGMPEGTGHDLIRNVRRLPPNEGGLTPAAALTAFASATDRLAAFEAGFQRHLPKPILPTQLVQAVADLAGLSRSSPS